MSDKPTTKQIHVVVPIEIYDDLKKYLPDHGAITSVIKRFLLSYVATLRKLDSKELSNNVGTLSSEIIKEDLHKGFIQGGN